jgi:hypothetical protein
VTSCHADDLVSRLEAYLDVRLNELAPCLTQGRMRLTPQMGVFQQPAKGQELVASEWVKEGLGNQGD